MRAWFTAPCGANKKVCDMTTGQVGEHNGNSLGEDAYEHDAPSPSKPSMLNAAERS
jgi:hypothetical protein